MVLGVKIRAMQASVSVKSCPAALEICFVGRRAKCRWQALRAIASKAMSIDLASVLLCTSLNVNVNDDAHAHCCRAKCWWQAWPWAIACKAMFIDLASVLLCTSLNVNDDAQVPAE
eukprot:scaffold3556_cov25-Tisochrysis_lutea.AAC.1